MKTYTKVFAGLLLTGTLIAGCSQDSETQDAAEAVAKAPALKDVTFTQEGNDVTISWDVENLTISEEHYGGEHVAGEGHAHVYVNGEKVAGLKKAEPYTVEDLPPGEHEIVLELQQNDHGSYNVKEETTITVE